ncbi:ecdysteroid-regulated 16 kDa protein-like [Lycorma delicatula]|uniref:ecdysteroid-regulated 16 kDa protein-like n=1 Tax=Lycorma delicatula TaxID=130591 RepID=UPI003F50D675
MGIILKECISVFLSIIFLLAVCLGTNITDCGSNGELNYINYTGCRNISEEACHIERGSNGTFTVEFTPVEQVYALTVKAVGILGGMELPLYIDNPDACLENGITCPVPANANQTYSTDLHIRSSLPKLSAQIRWKMQDQADNDVICVQFPVELC